MIEQNQILGSCGCSLRAANRHRRVHQPFPKTGPLGRNVNVQLDSLRQRIPERQAPTYCYIIATVAYADGRLVQTGSGPNLKGDRITLCTCKHYMRTFKSSEAWKGTWVAGFSGARVAKERNYLVYLMRVAHAFDSHRDLWFSDAVPTATKGAKAAHLNALGDVFQPKAEIVDPFAPDSYTPPCPAHPHAPCAWHKDVSYSGCSNRPAALLVGDPERSFLWDHPAIYSTFKLYRGQRKLSVEAFLRQLKEATSR